MDEIKNDKRFSHILTNPKYFKMGRKEHKFKVDSRFKEMFKNKNFKVNYTVDSRGRPWISSTNEDLKKFYDLSSSDESDKVEDKRNSKNTRKKEIKNEDPLESINANSKNYLKNSNDLQKLKPNNDKMNVDKKIIKSNLLKSSKSNSLESDVNKTDKSIKKDNDHMNDNYNDDEDDNDNSDDDDDDEDNDCADSIDSKNESYKLSDSDAESSSDNEFESNEIAHAWGELDHDAPQTESISSRLALCNMDWDRIKVNDILVMLNSFKPDDGVINCVKIFLSDYGKERLEVEKIKGPPELTISNNVQNEESEDDDLDLNNEENSSNHNSEGSRYHQEKLRQYQLCRLKYFYALIECDSAETADHIYKNCNGIEYEFSSNLIDLRFVPDNMEFEDIPVSMASTLPCQGTYKPTLYTNSALHQSNVELTWDETPIDRVAVTMQDFSKVDFENMDIKDYLASASEEEDELLNGSSDEEFLTNTEKEVPLEEQIQKYKNLLQNLDDGSDKSANDVDMEITWEPGLRETVEQKIEDKKTSELAPWEKYLDKKSKKKKLKKNKINEVIIEEESEKKPKGKDKKKRKKLKSFTDQEVAELELLVMDGNKKVKTEEINRKKKKKENKISSSIEKKNDMDGRFKEMLSDPRYNIDPSANEYQKIKKIKL